MSQLRGIRNDDMREMKLTKLLKQIDPEQERKTELQEEGWLSSCLSLLCKVVESTLTHVVLHPSFL